MSVCAVMLVKDEADIIRHTILHLGTQVDSIIVADNMSTDGTTEILDRLVDEAVTYHDFDLTVIPDPVVAYNQAEKTTALALRALDEGHTWVLPCDADEYWYAPDGRPIYKWLDGLAPDVMIVRAAVFNHIPSAIDPPGDNPFVTIGWRKKQPQELRFGKVLARCRPDLEIDMGNHAATTQGIAVEAGGLEIRHYSWRSADQYLKKIRNGAAAYAASDLPPNYGLHWRMLADHTDEAIRGHFREWFWSPKPAFDSSLYYDPIAT